MRPSVNMSDENRTTDIGNMYKKNLVKIARVVPEIYALSVGAENPFPAIGDAAYRKHIRG